MSARKRKSSGNDESFVTPARVIREVDIVDEVETMFIPFAHYSIADRAIPSAYDGLKPSQRRILWAMQYSGYTSKKPYVKSSRIVGDVIGSWHPHGDASVYGTMANMVKPYILNVPLVEGRGSFGFIAGDVESAARYTEARMQPISDMFMDDVKFSAVDMKPNFDERLEEPVNLPVIFPVLPINGASGIAVGFATNCAPHNPNEIIEATIARINNKDLTIDELLKIIPGPDFPTGCDIIGTDGIRDAYLTGRGLIKQRAKYRIVDETRGRHIIEFYEIPYNVAPTKILADINKASNNGKVPGITDAMDLMDKEHPVRIAVYVKSGFNATAVAEALIACCPTLYSTFAINQTALLGNAPRLMSMFDLLDCFIDFRRNVIKRRTLAQIKKCEHDKALQEGLAAVLLDIDEVISIVRNSDTDSQVYSRLKKKFGLDEEQARYVGGMRLIQLKRKDKLEVDKKIKALEKELKRLKNIIKNQKTLDAEVIKELSEAKELISQPRKSRIIKKTVEAYDNELKKGNTVASTNNSDDSSNKQNNMMMSGTADLFLGNDGTACHTIDGKSPSSYIKKIENVDLNSTVLVVFEDGSSVRSRAYELPEKKLGKLNKKVVGLIDFGVNEEKRVDIALITSGGKVKVLDSSTLTKNPECDVMNLPSSDKILFACESKDDMFFVFITDNANLLRFKVSNVNKQGRTSGGVAGIKLAKDADVLYATISNENDTVVSAAAKSIKTTLLSEFPEKGRGTQGVNCHKFVKGEEKLMNAYVGAKPNAKAKGKAISLPKPSARTAVSTKGIETDGIVFSEK